MTAGFFEAVKNLFPHGRAFELFIDGNKRRLIDGLSVLPSDIRREAEKAYLDLFPETTRHPDMWEKIFSLYLTEAEYEKRRDILGALWKTISGDQGANFLEQVLRSIHPDFYVVETEYKMLFLEKVFRRVKLRCAFIIASLRAFPAIIAKAL